MTVRETWKRVRDRLALSGIADAGIEAEVLLRNGLGMGRADFIAALNTPAAPESIGLVDRLVDRRLAGEPLAYIMGSREFYGLDFMVGPGVLIPRQETELLVDTVLDFSRGLGDPPLEIADVGTGSGAVAVASAYHLPSATVYATDASRDALRLADANRRRHGVAERVHLHLGDLLGPLPGAVDVILSNLPYVATDELALLPGDVQREPRLALDGGPDGLDVIRRLLRRAPSYLRPGGRLAMEIAHHQLQAVLNMCRESFPHSEVLFERDLMGWPRAVTVDLPREPQAGAGVPATAAVPERAA